MVLPVSALLAAAAAATEQRSQPGSLAFPVIWGPIRLAVVVAAAALLLVAAAALAAAGLAALAVRE
jgi:hypothetical protein